MLNILPQRCSGFRLTMERGGQGKAPSRFGARNRLARRARSVAIWLGVVAAIGGIFYGLANTSEHRVRRAAADGHRLHVADRAIRSMRLSSRPTPSLHLRLRHDARAVRRHRHDVSGPDRQHHEDSWNGAEGTELWRRLVKQVFVVAACLRVHAAGVAAARARPILRRSNIEFSTDRSRRRHRRPGRAAANAANVRYTLWLYNPAWH